MRAKYLAAPMRQAVFAVRAMTPKKFRGKSCVHFAQHALIGLHDPSRFMGRRVLDTGGFHRHESPVIGDLRSSDIRAKHGELGTGDLAKRCH
jgi:hypothetical protein